ncbi:hypothetical protein M407DRAFT_28363 [Tulasnella calospora MUT 4182]|uniref:Uncharacterized protein n=1 Tax=Tulasnella calospora MUT 4182 TaxID=1051891 RepID=A0A0C3KKY8_9AGAM|nr:hypothetical protein M407DRAFT_28363 [Tulasnella calospora MUT 4182]
MPIARLVACVVVEKFVANGLGKQRRKLCKKLFVPTLVQTAVSLLEYSSPQTAATNRLPSHNALGLHPAHNDIHSQELWSAPVPLSTGFNDASSTLSPLEGTNHPQNPETAQALSYGYRANHPFGSIAVPDSRDGVEVRGVAYLGAPRSFTRTEVGVHIMPRSQVPQTGAYLDGVAYGVINGMRSWHTGNYELVHGASSSSFQSSRKRSASFNTAQGLVEPHQQRYVHSRGGDLTWTLPPPDTGLILTRGSGNENSIAATATSLEAQRLMTTGGSRAQLACRMQTGES